MADAHSDSAEEMFPTPPGYPPHGEILRILGEGATSLSASTGRTYRLGVDAELRVLTAVRDDGYHAAFSLLPGPDAPRFVRSEGKRIGGEASPEERARLWFRYRVEDAVEGFVSGHDQEGD